MLRLPEPGLLAFQNVFRFGQMWEAQIKCREYLTTMNVHPARIDVTSESSILWLMRNIHVGNSQNPDYQEAKRLLIFLYEDCLVNTYKMLWGSYDN